MKLLPLLLILGLLASCSNKEPVKRRFFRMDTVTDIIIYNGKFGIRNKNIHKSIAQVDSLLLSWEKRFSAERVGSEVYEINNRTSDTVVVSNEMYRMVQTALAYSDSLSGSFDITVLPLKTFWNPVCNECMTPDPVDENSRSVVDSILQYVGSDGIKTLTDNRIAFSERKLQIDLGGIAKGEVIQELKQILMKQGMTDFLISAGGDILVEGRKNNGDSFKVGVQHPRADKLAALFTLEGGSVVTSGDYERFRIAKSGERVHHLFDPETGFPAKNNSSITVVGADPVIVDILSTALFSWHADSIINYIENRSEFECMIITAEGRKIYSTGFDDLLAGE